MIHSAVWSCGGGCVDEGAVVGAVVGAETIAKNIVSHILKIIKII